MKHKKTIITSIILLAIGLIVSALVNSTYALFSSDSYGANTNAYSTGMLSIEASSKTDNISLDNVLPMTDEDGLKTNPYVFTIKNVGNLDYLFDVKLLSVGDSSTTFLPQYIKLQIDDGYVTTLSSLSNGEIKSDITLLAGESIDISIRVWLSIDTPNTEMGKSFNSRIVTDGKAVYTSTNNEYRETAVQHITNLYRNAVKTEVTNNNIVYNQAQSVSLMNDRLGGTIDDYNSGNIRYYGAAPDNYIYFNCSDYQNQSDETCERWRIIGVFEDKVKIIKEDVIGSYAWDDVSSGEYDNNWATATLNTYLNGTYYNALNTSTKNMISFSTYYLCNASINDMNLYSDSIYQNENCSYELGDNIISHDNYVALMYASDYGYGADFNFCNNSIDSYNNTACSSNNWLFKSNRIGHEWLLTRYTLPYNAWIIASAGNSYGYDSAETETPNTHYVRPILYLNSDVYFNDIGNGSSKKPYQIYVEPPVTLVEHITNLYKENYDSSKDVTFSNDTGMNYYAPNVRLMNDGLDSTGTMTNDPYTGNIRYYGADDENLNNYIYFNCSDYSDTSTCEVWRIIGIVDGKVKLIRNSSLGEYSWDYTSTGEYDNDWTDATLNVLLNNAYYKSESVTYYNNSTTGTLVSFESNGITEVTRDKKLISESNWYTNEIVDFYMGKTAYLSYIDERTGSNVDTSNIGLAYPSDYGYGADLNVCKGDLYVYGYSTECMSSNWLTSIFKNVDDYYAVYWFISPDSSGNYVMEVDYGQVNGALGGTGSSPHYQSEIVPVLYLNPDLVLEKGNGSIGEPYQLKVG